MLSVSEPFDAHTEGRRISLQQGTSAADATERGREPHIRQTRKPLGTRAARVSAGATQSRVRGGACAGKNDGKDGKRKQSRGRPGARKVPRGCRVPIASRPRSCFLPSGRGSGPTPAAAGESQGVAARSQKPAARKTQTSNMLLFRAKQPSTHMTIIKG